MCRTGAAMLSSIGGISLTFIAMQFAFQGELCVFSSASGKYPANANNNKGRRSNKQQY
jgi:hypothetical protein